MKTTKTRRWRPEVEAFADAMEAQLLANDHKPGWKRDFPSELLRRLKEESTELSRELREWDGSNANSPKRVLKEAADVANFAMMIADVCGGLALRKGGGA